MVEQSQASASTQEETAEGQDRERGVAARGIELVAVGSDVVNGLRWPVAVGQGVQVSAMAMIQQEGRTTH